MAEQIRRDLSEIIRDEIKDPRLGLFTITEVRLSKDLGQALVFCSVLNQEQSRETIDTLNRATGFLRSQIAARIRARTVPALKFRNDDSQQRGEAMDALISQAVNADQAHGDDEDGDPH
jgi:ribosome-binding factor A